MPKHILPQAVLSPRKQWSMIFVLHAGQAGEHALALGKWNDRPVLGLRWNGTDASPIGNPQSRGLPVWFVVPDELEDAIIDAYTKAKKLSPEMLAMARAILESKDK